MVDLRRADAGRRASEGGDDSGRPPSTYIERNAIIFLVTGGESTTRHRIESAGTQLCLLNQRRRCSRGNSMGSDAKLPASYLRGRRDGEFYDYRGSSRAERAAR